MEHFLKGSRSQGQVVIVKECLKAKEILVILGEAQIFSLVSAHPKIISFHAIAINLPEIFIVTLSLGFCNYMYFHRFSE